MISFPQHDVPSRAVRQIIPETARSQKSMSIAKVLTPVCGS
jgi:hypothetical protein